jgi:hypothetical protein
VQRNLDKGAIQVKVICVNSLRLSRQSAGVQKVHEEKECRGLHFRSDSGNGGDMRTVVFDHRSFSNLRVPPRVRTHTIFLRTGR